MKGAICNPKVSKWVASPLITNPRDWRDFVFHSQIDRVCANWTWALNTFWYYKRFIYICNACKHWLNIDQYFELWIWSNKLQMGLWFSQETLLETLWFLDRSKSIQIYLLCEIRSGYVKCDQMVRNSWRLIQCTEHKYSMCMYYTVYTQSHCQGDKEYQSSKYFYGPAISLSTLPPAMRMFTLKPMKVLYNI